MRTTASSTYRSIQLAIRQSNSRVDGLYLQASTGKKLTRASDDPTAVAKVDKARSAITGMDRYMENIEVAQDRMDTVDSYIDSAETVMARAREIAVAGINGSLTDDDLQSYAEEVAALQEQMLGIANTRVDGKYLFAGFSDTTEPYSGDPVTYNGTSDHKYLQIGPGQTVQTNITGDELFSDPVDIFAALSSLQEALSGGDTTAMGDQLDTLENAATQITRQRSKMGNINARMEDSMSLMEDAKLQMQDTLSSYEDADLVEVLSDMTLAEESLEAALSVSTRVMSLSILDYL